MNYRVKKILTIFLFIIICFATNIYASTNTQVRTKEDLKIWDSFTVTDNIINSALKTPKVDETEKIYDFADLLTDEEEKSIYSQIVTFIEQNNLDMAVVTIKENNKSSAMAYADDFYDYNYFGTGTNRDGLLLLIDMQNRTVWISTTGQGILIYDNSRIDKMLDAIAPNLTSMNYKEAVSNFISSADSFANSGIPNSNKGYYIDENGNYIKRKEATLKDNIQVALIFSSIVTGIFILIGVLGHRNVHKASQAGMYLDKNSVKITDRRDMFLTTYTSKVKIETSSSGGSSIHSGSSGGSHGGGGRGF